MRVVRRRENRIGDIPANFRFVDVEGGTQFDVPNMVAAEFHIHKARHRHVAARLGVMREPLNEGRGTIADAHNADPELARAHATLSPIAAGRRDARLVVFAETR